MNTWGGGWLIQRKHVKLFFSFEITNIREERKRMVSIIVFSCLIKVKNFLSFTQVLKDSETFDGILLSSRYFPGYSLEL